MTLRDDWLHEMGRAEKAEARVEAAEQAMTAALHELERSSDVRTSAFKLIGNAALILQAALAAPPVPETRQ